MFTPFVVVAANTLTSLQNGHKISGNPVTSSTGASRSTAVGGGPAATIARAPNCRETLAVLDRRVRVVEDEDFDMSPDSNKGHSLVQRPRLASNK
jgi:hypothetical protein